MRRIMRGFRFDPFLGSMGICSDHSIFRPPSTSLSLCSFFLVMLPHISFYFMVLYIILYVAIALFFGTSEVHICMFESTREAIGALLLLYGGG